MSIHAEHCRSIHQQGRCFDLAATTIDHTINEVWSDELDSGDVDLDEATRNTIFQTCTGLGSHEHRHQHLAPTQA